MRGASNDCPLAVEPRQIYPPSAMATLYGPFGPVAAPSVYFTVENGPFGPTDHRTSMTPESRNVLRTYALHPL